jgi:16S rRNA (uracil1498-N3)-methyltransferase
MSCARIYLCPETINDTITLKDKEIIHKLTVVLRLMCGEQIRVFNGIGTEYSCQIEKIEKKQIVLGQTKILRQENAPKVKIILGFPLTKEEKIDFILQKSTELGVSQFVPFISCHSVQNKPSLAKIVRWQKIIAEACRQSTRLWLPILNDTIELSALLNYPAKLKLFTDINAKSFQEKINQGDVLLLNGPEGDFSPREKQMFKQAGFISMNLSANILRMETAAIFSVGLAAYLVNNES